MFHIRKTDFNWIIKDFYYIGKEKLYKRHITTLQLFIYHHTRNTKQMYILASDFSEKDDKYVFKARNSF